jgi:molecular chaperone IbpA
MNIQNIEKFYGDLNNHFNKIRANTIGLDKVFDDIHRHMTVERPISPYPPYNIMRTDRSNIEDGNVQDQFVIEVAAAGFKKEELTIEQKENTLYISGVDSSEDNELDFVVHSIGKRKFKRQFLLADNAEVSDCKYVDGLLTVTINVVVPEEEQPKRIDIK